MCDHRGSPARPQAASRRRPPAQRSCRLPGRTDGTSGDSKRVRTDLRSSTIGQERANVPPFKLHCIDNMDLELPSKLHNALEREASDAGRSLHAHVVKKLESITPPVEAVDRGVVTTGLPKLVAFLSRGARRESSLIGFDPGRFLVGEIEHRSRPLAGLAGSSGTWLRSQLHLS
jgi:hypothetical protein